MSAARLNYNARMCAVIKARHMLAFPTDPRAEILVDRKHFVLIYFHINIQKQTIKGLRIMQNRAGIHLTAFAVNIYSFGGCFYPMHSIHTLFQYMTSVLQK